MSSDRCLFTMFILVIDLTPFVKQSQIYAMTDVVSPTYMKPKAGVDFVVFVKCTAVVLVQFNTSRIVWEKLVSEV